MQRSFITKIIIGALALLSQSAFSMMGAAPYLDNVHRYYGRVDLGYNIFQPLSATTSSAFTPFSVINAGHPTINNQFGCSAGIGYKASQTLRTDVTLTYRPTMTLQLLNDAPATGRGSLSNYTFMLNGYYDFQWDLPVTIYAMAGVGASSNTTKNLRWQGTTPMEFGDTISHFSWQVGPGMSYQMTTTAWLDLNYQWIDLGQFAQSNLTSRPPTQWQSLLDNQLQLGVRVYL